MNIQTITLIAHRVKDASSSPTGRGQGKKSHEHGKVDVLDMELIQSQEKFRHLSQASVIQHLLHNSKQNRKKEDGKKESSVIALHSCPSGLLCIRRDDAIREYDSFIFSCWSTEPG